MYHGALATSQGAITFKQPEGQMQGQFSWQVLQVTLPLLSTFALTSLKVSISAGASLSVLNDKVFSKTQVFGAVNCALIFVELSHQHLLLCGFFCFLIIDNDLLLLVNKSFWLILYEIVS